MSSIRVYVVLVVILVQLQSIHSKPFLFDLLCDLLCDDDDTSTTTTSSSTEDFFDVCDCTPTTRRPNNRQQFGPSAFNMRLPPSNGMNLSLNNTNGVWSFNLDALQPGQNGFGFVTPPAGGLSSAATTIAGNTAAAETTAAPTTAAAK
ncbi:unnamed protein product [Euphydryas editha]|uniref:Uncharacterized protein n=1 Tax=Euphydryas editha TaxID=104508 RepID=A0AAU9TIK8_EUPED|nr:unnamed protein product [Euphydryas editha]